MNTVKNNIITEFGLDKLSEEDRMEILTKMTETVLKSIAVAVLERLSADERLEFEKLQDNATPEEMDKFLTEKIDDYEGMVNRVVSEFKDDMKGSIANIKKSLEA